MKVYGVVRTIGYDWNVGAQIGFVYVIMVITGLSQLIEQNPSVEDLTSFNVEAGSDIVATHNGKSAVDTFARVNNIAKENVFGYMIRNAHVVGASAFMFLIIAHVVRNVDARSYYRTSVRMWLTGVALIVLSMGVAFTGYVILQSQMSYWAVTVITNMVSVVPVVGGDLLYYIWGSESVTSRTERRIMVVHFLLPFVVAGIVVAHLVFLHIDQTSVYRHIRGNPASDVKLLPLSLWRDALVATGIFLVFWHVVISSPEIVSHPDNYVPADPAVTPKHIVPEQYFLAPYGVLRLMPDKVFGMIVMVLSLLSLLLIAIQQANPVAEEVGGVPSLEKSA